MLNRKADNRAEAAITYDSQGNKLCPIHKNRELLVPEGHKGYTGMCGNPDCVAKNIMALVGRSKVWRQKISLFHQLQVWEDFVSFIYEELLKEALAGKPTIINPTWFRFKMLSFTHQELKRGYAVLSKVPSLYRSEHLAMIDSWEQDVIDREWDYFETKKEEAVGQIDEALFNKEVMDFVEKKWGKEWVLFLSGEIDRLAIAKLYRIPVNRLKRKEKLVFRSIISHFLDGERKEELLSQLGEDNQTPLKDILTYPREEGNHRGGNQIIYPRYWETLADKINNSTGLSYQDKKKWTKKEALEAELDKLNKELEGRDVCNKLEKTTT